MTGGSGAKTPSKRCKADLLAPDDASLWQRIARSITPLRQAKQRIPKIDPALPDPGPGRPGSSGAAGIAGPSAPEPLRGTPRKAPAAKPSAPESGAGTRRGHPTPQPALERRQARRIAAGTVEIEARLDLHGLTQLVAHAKLADFLERAAAAGMKTVLIITGKGGRKRFLDNASGSSDGDPGVLRASVPRWLAEAPLKRLVVSYQPAAVRHGGEGALYVLLRRKRRP